MGPERRLGLTIGSAFGLVFVLVNAGALPSSWPLVLRTAGLLAFAGVLVALRAAAQRPPAARVGGSGFTRGYWVVVAVEVVALVTGPMVLARVFDAPEAGVAWVSSVVGVHFFALAVLWREPTLHVLATALTACGAAGLLLAATDATEAVIATVGGVAPGFVLLLGAGVAATNGGQVTQDA